MDPVPQVSGFHGVTNVTRDGGRQQRRPGGREFEADLEQRRRPASDAERETTNGGKSADKDPRKVKLAAARARLQQSASLGRNNRSHGGSHVDVLA